MENNAHSCVLL
jgi:hypothetical protein